MTVWQIYRFIIIEFIVEYAVFCILFFLRLSRRRLFWVRAPLSLAGIFALGIPLAFLYSVKLGEYADCLGNTITGRVAIYFMLFMAFVLFSWLCFDEKFVKILFICSMAYATQNLSYKLYLVIWTIGEQCGWYNNWGDMFEVYYRLMYYAIFAVCVTGIYFAFIRRVTKKLQGKELNYRMLILVFLVLSVTIILCSLDDVCFAHLSVERENHFDMEIYYVMRQTSNAFSIVCCTIILLLSSKTIVQNELQREVEFLRYTVRQGEMQYAISKDSIERINIKCHDIKYKLDALAAQGGISAESLKNLRDSIEIYDARLETGNRLLNVLITEKSLYCEQNGINLSCMVDGSKLEFMETGDLYCLVGNIIDNALEAVKRIAENERRVINLVVKAKDDIIIVQEENYFNGTLEFYDGLPVTTKADKENHGFGMRSLRMIVKKYGGELNAYATDDNVFHINVIFGTPNKM